MPQTRSRRSKGGSGCGAASARSSGGLSLTPGLGSRLGPAPLMPGGGTPSPLGAGAVGSGAGSEPQARL